MIIDFYNKNGGSGSGYTLPIATETRLGGIKVGSGLTIDPSTGVLSASGETDLSNYTTTAVTAELSAATSGIAVDMETLSATTSGLSVQIEALSGAIPTIQVEQELSAGTKIATITVNGSDTDLYAPAGGAGEQDYVIVDALSAITTPKEGMTAWVNSGTQTYGPYTVISFNSSECGGGQLSWDGDYAYLTGDDPTEIDNGNGWSTPTSEWTAVGGRSNLYIKYDSSTHMFSVMFAFNVSNLNVTVYDTTYTETSDTLTLPYDGYFSRRIKGNWIRTEYHLENMTPAQRVQAHSEIISMSGQSYTDIFWKNKDGGISKANYWLVDWSDGASIRCAANQGDVWYNMTFRSNGSVGENSNGRVRDKVKRWEFGFNRTTSAFTANSFDSYDGYITWDGNAIIEASVYESTNNYKMSSGNIVHIWKATDGELYNNYYFGFNFVDDTDGTEWKTKWYAENGTATFVSMTQV